MRLATFLHISDLHFGRIDPATFDARAPGIWAKSKHFDGLLGHQYRSLVRLEKFYTRLYQEEEAQLIVTGDLTTVGHKEEFDTANEFLGGRLTPPKGNDLGLEVENWNRWAIPGNHDYWPGLPTIIGPPTAELRMLFPNLPMLLPPFNLPGGHELHFLWISTDEDVSPWRSDRILARGSFTSQLADLDGMLGVPENHMIRVLCLHHSPSHNGFTLRMDHRSRASLNDFIVEHDIAVLLCGHIHTPQVRSFTARHTTTGKSVKCVEGRCGTTTLRTTLPFEWKTVLGNRPGRPKRHPNSLLVHRLFEEDDKLFWNTETYMENTYRFELARDPVSHIEIWPC